MADEGAGAGDPGWGTPSSKVVQWYDPMITATGAVGLSGYEFMSAIRDGKLPPPPIASLVMRLDAVS